MANSKQAEKRGRQTIKRTAHNTSIKTRVKSTRKALAAAVAAGHVDVAGDGYECPVPRPVKDTELNTILRRWRGSAGTQLLEQERARLLSAQVSLSKIAAYAPETL